MAITYYELPSLRLFAELINVDLIDPLEYISIL